MLLAKCPNAIQVHDRVFEIDTSARLWLNISIELSKLDKSDIYLGYKVIDILFQAVKDKKLLKEEYNKKLVERLYWFLNLGKTTQELKDEAEKSTVETEEKLYSFEKDETLIFSAFYKTYHIDIEQEIDNLHWWKFMAMFSDLDEKSKFVNVYMYYRGLNIDDSVIYKNASEREKQKILEMKRFVSLGYNEPKGSVSESEEARIKEERRKILEAKNGNNS